MKDAGVCIIIKGMNYIEKLKLELGEGKVSDAEEHRAAFARDESGIPGLYLPDVVVHPESTEDVSKVARIAYEYEVPMTPRGAGTSLSGGPLAVRGGILVVFDRMNSIRDIDTENLVVTTEPGVITETLQKEVEKQGMFYPPDPASLDQCTIGGNVATDAGGPRALKYGVTKHYLLELEVVMPDGEVMRVGKKTKKWVAGYDLPMLFSQSEGTLGFITEISLRLIPLPEYVQTFLVPFADEVEASKVVSEIIAKKFLPRALEFIDKSSIDAAGDAMPPNIPSDARAILLVELDGREDAVMLEAEQIAEIFEKHNAMDIIASMDEKDRERIWTARRDLLHALEATGKKVRIEDITVPRSRIPEAVEAVYRIQEEVGLTLAVFGHAGDGNIHVNILYDDDQIELVDKVVHRLCEVAVELDGTITGEHGIGILKKPHLKLEQPEPLIQLQKNIKKLFDPKGLMNPDKKFP